MHKETAFVNKLVKRKEYERSMEYHLENIKNVKPITRPLENPDVSINNRKKQYNNEQRFTEIQRQNRILLQKISSIMNKTKRGNSFLERANKSLNSTFRRKQNQDIEIENARLLKRLQEKRPNIDTDKLNRDWAKQKNVMKIMSNFPFMISDRPGHRAKRNSTTQMDKQRRINNQFMQPIEMVRMRVINGFSFLITVQLSSKMMRITGDCKDRKQLKVIEIERSEAIEFIEEECHSKLEQIFNHLRYDQEEHVLYLVGNEVQLEQLIAKQRQNYESVHAQGNNRNQSEKYVFDNPENYRSAQGTQNHKHPQQLQEYQQGEEEQEQNQDQDQQADKTNKNLHEFKEVDGNEHN